MYNSANTENKAASTSGLRVVTQKIDKISIEEKRIGNFFRKRMKVVSSL